MLATDGGRHALRVTFEAESSGYEGDLYRIDVILFTTEMLDDGTDHVADGQYYEHGGGGHPFECLFTDLKKARAHAGTFDRAMATNALETTDLVGSEHVAVEVNMMPWDEDAKD